MYVRGSDRKLPEPNRWMFSTDAGYYVQECGSGNLVDVENSGCMCEVRMGVPGAPSSRPVESSKTGVDGRSTPPQLAYITLLSPWWGAFRDFLATRQPSSLLRIPVLTGKRALGTGGKR